MNQTDIHWLRQAYINARDLSDDPSTQNGSVLVPVKSKSNEIVYGANRLPRGITATRIDVWSKERKYCWMTHAEADVIQTAAFRGVSTEGATLYCPWYACTACARAIIGAGITRVVGDARMKKMSHPSWNEEIAVADTMLDQAGVRRCYLSEDLFGFDADHAVLFQGVYWIP